ncbi:SLBB domain-containing protein [Kamptonema cortianum]|uniref:SLBB domain-containing protein n=1 Tax=Geitlerinema calcuttense NRMC-F 0142 TaxID=2922238 RepID=A0ABT7LYB6_9CYAN|nr:SLBB domain-containing protein [Geitlerinema calcuttense]MDK3157431.1 SLBB domain-containing protein [Kamptonema cortianum]MDL5057003.1 SLBB domain-containing protein [Geitlerinema calcuttense NRMC-F 0142]
MNKRIKNIGIASGVVFTVLVGEIAFKPMARAQLPALPEAAPLPATPLQLDTTYRLGPGDRVRVDIFNVPEYSGEFLILSDGSLNLPLGGSIPVQGLTLQQAQEQISARMARFLRRPLITLSLTQIRPIRIAIAGEINRPGTYTFTLATTGEVGLPTVTRIIEQAGGITQAADLRQIQIRRPRLDIPRDASGNPTQADQILTVDLWQLLRAGDITQDLALRDGDSLFIPTSTQVNLDEAAQLSNASFADRTPRSINVAVVGEVRRQGPYTLETSTANNVASLTRAIQVAGGITPTADIRNIQVRRPTKSGQAQTIEIDFWKLLQEGDIRQDIPLQNGDTIVVATATDLAPDEATELASTSFSPEKITINVVGEAMRPGAVEVAPNTPLLQGLLAAGGFNAQARRNRVELIRLNPNGTVSRQTIAVDFNQPLNDQTNPPLRNNDTIVVNRSAPAQIADTLNPFLRVVGTVGGLVSFPGQVFQLFRLLNFGF